MVAARTQNQALNALVFFFRHVVKRSLCEIEPFVRAKLPRKLPEVMTREEIEARLEGVHAIMAGV
jgi:site-specific recombinase XerD